jgi:hypothetical protein
VTDDHDAARAARSALGGRPLNIATSEIFARLGADLRSAPQELLEARRAFDAMKIGIAVEAVEKADDQNGKFRAMLRLARALHHHLSDRRPGWFRFLMVSGAHKGESLFQFAVIRRPHSSGTRPARSLKRATQSRRTMIDMLIAGAILHRIDTAKASGIMMSIHTAIGAAINDGDILTDEDAPRSAFQRFRKHCAELTGGGDTYRLQQYTGSIKKYQGRWVALPATGAGVSHLPSRKGGRPRTS